MKTAARLRAVHASLPDLSPEERNGYLMDEIEYALEDAASIPGQSRQSLFKTLEDYFPVFGDSEPSGPPPPPEPLSCPKQPEPSQRTVESLLEEVCARSEELTQAQMQKLADLLAAHGGAKAAETVPKLLSETLSLPASPSEIEDFTKSVTQLWVEFGATPDSEVPLRLNRLLKMLGILTGGFRDIYRFVWPFWGEMATREIKMQVAPNYPNGLELAVRSFVTGGDVGGGEFHREVEKTKRLLISILFGMRKGAEDYGKLYERKLSPEAVADTVMLEESASDPGRVREFGRKCWDKYSHIAKHHTADAIHDEIVRSVAAAAFTKLKISS